MTENERDFARAVARLHIDAEPDPAHKERLRRRMMQAYAEAPGREASSVEREAAVATRDAPRLTLGAWWSPVKLAVAAAIVVAAGAGLWRAFVPGGGPPSVAQVCQATREMPWLHAVTTNEEQGEVRTEEHWYDFAGAKAYVVRADGSVSCREYGVERRELTYSPRVRALAVTDLPARGVWGAASAYTAVDAFAVLAAQDDVEVRQWPEQFEGQAVRAYEMEKAEPGLTAGGQSVAALRVKMMADPETNRIMAADVEHRDAAGAALARQQCVMSYPLSGPQSVYDLGVPRSARVVEMRKSYIGTPGHAPTPAPAETPASRLVPLKIDLPKPTFLGTPQDNRVPRLARPRRGPRPPFLVPPGTTNVALGKPVSASDEDPVIGRLEMITDGDKEAADGSFVELGPSLQHVTIDLGGLYEIFAVVVWHYHQQPRVYFDVVVQVCDEPSFKRDVTTVFNNDIDGSARFGRGGDLHYTETNEGKLIDTRGVQGRYVRLYSNGNTSDDQNHYIEVEVYGRPSP
jgi:hypothetical protein